MNSPNKSGRAIKAMAEAMNKATKSEMEKVFLL
jgi:hypothetical protein